MEAARPWPFAAAFFPPVERLRDVLLRALRAEVALAEIERRLRRFLRRRFEIAEGNLGAALHHAAAEIGEADEIHRLRIARICRAMRPLHGLGIVFGDSFPIPVATGQIQLGGDIAADGAAAEGFQPCMVIG